MNFEEFVTQLDEWGKSATPFFFLVDFEQKKPIAFRIPDVPGYIKYDFNGKKNYSEPNTINPGVEVIPIPVDEQEFRKKFDIVHKHLRYGDSYLANLTVRTEIKINATLGDIFSLASAKYKLLYGGEFLVFSPETFVQVRDGYVYAYPMKGTIDASIVEAETKVLNDKKEQAEHVTIVDLIRNDLSHVASEVMVKRFRYIDTIRSNNKTLLQVSSEIQAMLTPHYQGAFGSILKKMLPAGSISGAPKKRTVEIIQEAENAERGYYTGVAGIFDGKAFDSGVLIRFIENDNGRFFYRSGGGITTASEWKREYREVIDKIYVPAN